MPEQEQSVQHFLDLIQKSKRGKFKIYIGMSAGVGKTYRMLQEAHALLKNNIDVQIGYIETHNRPETHQLLAGLPFIARRTLFYKGKELAEMDVAAILTIHPEVVLVDELAHTNLEGSKNEKRWQDVVELLNAGINVISAVNIQHLESLNAEIEAITGIQIKERVPDRVLRLADEVVNIDLTAEELITRLKEGKIYDPSKIEIALNNFFKTEKILQLREMALREVAHQVERKIEAEIPATQQLRPERFMACISTNEASARKMIRKTARLASYYHSSWLVLYVQTGREAGDKIGLAAQRHLINNLKLATQLGAEVIKIKNDDVAQAIADTATQKQITTVCIGRPHLSFVQYIFKQSIFSKLLQQLPPGTDLIILA
ncbi:sensor protein KdpD [Adhaeribacter pallidiroseus]|uniref:Histidine kinase n=1 Tax=Adhaeribacter pallidiroseus TaxID=2072847 RepID=A0A369QRJ7_9BACT|nr:sensor protein KdpD [Adhaeribacter pallidiroseus]RDC65936.1 Histidine kinase [Adhaeribacter pallidiroseus]